MSIAPSPTPAAPAVPDGFRAVAVFEGLILDPETGEFLATEGEGVLLEDPREGPIWAPSPARPPFVVDSLEKAEWVLEKVAKAQAQAGAVRARREVLLANLDRQERQYRAAIDGLLGRFGGQLEAVARETLEARGGKSRTLVLDHGTLSFRRTQGATSVVDPDAALEWAKAHQPNAVSRKEWVTATNARKAVEALMVDGVLSDYPAWLEVTGPRDSFSVKTGLEG